MAPPHRSASGLSTIAWVVSAAIACGSEQRSAPGPRPESAEAACTMGIYGGGSSTAIRSDGSIMTTAFGANTPSREQPEPRDSVAVSGLLDDLSRLRWSTLKSDDGLTDVQCSIKVAWSDTTRIVQWHPATPARELAELVRVHRRILALSKVAASSAPTPAAPDTAQDRGSALQGPPVPGDTVPLLETGCGGGVTGGGGGTFLTTSGAFYRYRRNGPAPIAPRSLTFVRRDSVRAAALVDAAVRDGITRIAFSEPSNMTCHLSLAGRDTSYSIAWPIGTTPPPIRRLVALAKELEDAASR